MSRKGGISPRGRYGVSGSLTANVEIKGVTQKLEPENAKYYGGRYFIAEAMYEETAKILCKALGLKYVNGRTK